MSEDQLAAPIGRRDQNSGAHEPGEKERSRPAVPERGDLGERGTWRALGGNGGRSARRGTASGRFFKRRRRAGRIEREKPPRRGWGRHGRQSDKDDMKFGNDRESRRVRRRSQAAVAARRCGGVGALRRAVRSAAGVPTTRARRRTQGGNGRASAQDKREEESQRSLSLHARSVPQKIRSRNDSCVSPKIEQEATKS